VRSIHHWKYDSGIGGGSASPDVYPRRQTPQCGYYSLDGGSLACCARRCGEVTTKAKIHFCVSFACSCIRIILYIFCGVHCATDTNSVGTTLKLYALKSRQTSAALAKCVRSGFQNTVHVYKDVVFSRKTIGNLSLFGCIYSVSNIP